MDVDKDPVKVNPILGQRASIGPIPADQLIPWVFIGVFSYFIFSMLLGVGILPWLGTWIWIAASWWILTGSKTYAFIKSWVQPPGVDWINAETLFVRATDAGTWRRAKQDKLRYVKQTSSEDGKTRKFMPFQNFSHIHSIAEIQLGGYSFACLVLYDKANDSWSAQIPFKFSGIHPQLYRNEVESAISALHEACSEFNEGEFLTFQTSCKSITRNRKKQLRELAKTSDSKAIGVQLLNEEQRVKELAASGARQVWEQIIWGSWTAQKDIEERTDLIGKILLWIKNKYQSSITGFMGTKQSYFNDFYEDLARQIHERGFLKWRNLLETKGELLCEPMSAREIWQHLWYRFNIQPAPTLPQNRYIQVIEEQGGLQTNVPQSGQKDLITLLVQGDRGKTSCPKHQSQRGFIYSCNKVGRVVTIEQPPELWRNAREQLKWIWNRLSTTYVRDTDAVIQISSREKWAIQDELEKMTKQSKYEERRAVAEGTGKGVAASMQGEHAEDALRKMLEGKQPLYCAPVFVIWRDSEEEANEAARQFCQAFGSATATVEDDIAWRVWVESLPINSFPLLEKYSAFSERRLTLDSETVPGFLPLTRPRDLDSRGVEFLNSRGGHPIYVNLLDPQTGRALITGKTGSGKSVLGWRFVLDALAQNIPVVGIDLSSGGDSTFKTAVLSLGEEKGAYVDILRESLNILEPPDLRTLAPEVQVQRLKRWKDVVRTVVATIAMAQIEDPQLHSRVDSICLRLLEVFFADVDITNRYNNAFEQGWKSEAWGEMPTLHDLLKFCSKEKLGLESYEEIDARAINQIVNQVGAKLQDPNIGDAIGRPSTVSPYPLITFYALSGLSNEQNATIMALSAQMAALRNALASSQSLFVGDELSVLLDKPGFADVVGEMLATGRKEGISTLMLAQDLDAIVNCKASAKILANLSTQITGKTTYAATAAYANALGYDRELIAQNASESYRGSKHELYTRWRVERNNRFWDARFYAAPMMLASLANGESEVAARDRVLAGYPSTEKGRLRGLRDFTDQYVMAMRGSTSFSEVMPTTTGSTVREERERQVVNNR